MSKRFDMELFLSGVAKGSYATRQRHIRQARTIQSAINHRWQRDNPWTWQQKHFRWFLSTYLSMHSEATRYYYRLTIELIATRLTVNMPLHNRRGKPL